MATFSADEIIGKTLIAKNDVDIVRLPNDNSETVFVVNEGEPIGTVVSYLKPKTNRTAIYWQFMDSYNKPYYVRHKQGLFDVKNIQVQGGKTTETKQQEKEEAAKSNIDKISDNIQKLVLFVGFVYLAKSAIESRK